MVFLTHLFMVCRHAVPWIRRIQPWMCAAAGPEHRLRQAPEPPARAPAPAGAGVGPRAPLGGFGPFSTRGAFGVLVALGPPRSRPYKSPREPPGFPPPRPRFG